MKFEIFAEWIIEYSFIRFWLRHVEQSGNILANLEVAINIPFETLCMTHIACICRGPANNV